MNGLAVCAGYNGLGLALRLASRSYRDICYVEREAYAAGILAAQMEAGTLAPALIWDDLRTFRGRPLRGRVDCITAGIPCQPFSAAGQKRGIEDERWLWPELYRIVREVRPRFVLLEEVDDFVGIALGLVIGDLAQSGYRYAYDIFSASEVGGTHQRDRCYLLAYADGGGCFFDGERDGDAAQDAANWHSRWSDDDRRDPSLDDTLRVRLRPERELRPGRGAIVNAGQDAMVDAERAERDDCERQASGWFGKRSAYVADAQGVGQSLRDSESRRLGRSSSGGNQAHVANADPRLAEQRRGPAGGEEAGWWPHGGFARPDAFFPPAYKGDNERWAYVLGGWPWLAPAQPGVRYLADGTPGILDKRLRTMQCAALGNGVVALTGALAVTVLAHRLGVVLA